MFWRKSALGCSRSWSSVVLTSTKPTIAYLERARTTPLPVFYEESLHKDWAAVVLHDILENHTSRIECLHIDAFWATARMLSAVLASPMPSLRSLSLSVGSLDAPAQDTITLTAAFTGISNLRRLAVSNFAPWSCYSFPGLTHLALFRIASRDMGRRLLDMLAACLHLEVIYIAHIYPKDEGFEPGFDDRSRVISLPCLRSFQAVYLRCEDWPSIFLSHLEVPPHCEFCLQVNNGLDVSSLSLLPDAIHCQPRTWSSRATTRTTTE